MREGNTRRSSEPSIFSSGMWSSTSGSKIQVPALAQELGASPGAGFSTKRTMRSSAELDDAEAAGVVDGRERDAQRGAVSRWRCAMAERSRSVITSPLQTKKAPSRSRGRLLDGEAGAEGLALVGVAEARRRARAIAQSVLDAALGSGCSEDDVVTPWRAGWR